MYLLKSFSITHNTVLHVLYRFFLVLQIICAVALLSFPLSYANEHGATVFAIPVAIDDFPDSQEKLETLLHHKTGLKMPRIYKDQVSKCYKNAMQLTPSWLKSHYGTLPLFSVIEKNATQAQLTQYSLSHVIESIESDECQDEISFVNALDKKIANTLNTCNQLLSFPFLEIRKSSITFSEFESFLCPLNYEGKQVPITLPISFNRWQKMFQHHASAEKTNTQLSCMHKKFQSIFENTPLTLPTYMTLLEVSNKHHVKHLRQTMLHVSNVIVQTHGRQKVVLMPPISEQPPYPHWLDLTGQFLFNKEIDLSASNSILNNESRLAHATLYSVYLNPGDMLLVPAHWFIYRKSLSTSVSMSLNHLSSDKWRFFCSQAESMGQKYAAESMGQKYAAESMGQKYAAESMGQKYAAESMGQKYAAESMGQKYAAESMGQKYAAESMGQKYAAESMGQKYAAESMGQKYAAESMGQKYAAESMGQKYAVEPMEQKYEVEPMEQKSEHTHLIPEKHVVTKWACMEIQKNPHNAHNIIHACKNIQAAISDETQQVLDLSCLNLSSLPDAIFRIPHIATLNLSKNN